MPRMRGDLSETSVADLCRGLSDAEATGAVELDGPEGAARVFFRQGAVYWAMSPAPRARLGDRLVNGGLLTAEQLEQALAAQRDSTERSKLGAILADQGLVTRDVIRVFVQEQILDALFDLMRWRDGSYAFRAGDAASEKLPIDIPVDQLLVEVSRRQSEWDQIEATIPSLDMIPDFVLGGSSANAALEPDEFAVLASLDGHRTIRELADALGYSEFEAARIVYGLTLLGIVDVAFADEDASEEGEAEQAREAESAEPPGEVDAVTDAGDAGDEPSNDDASSDAPDDERDELEVELDDLAGDDIDIAAALEEALADPDPTPGATPPPTDRPRVRVHVSDDATGYVPPRQVSDDRLEPATDRPSTDAPAPAASARVAAPGTRSTEDLTTALTAALDEDAPSPSDASQDEDSDQGPAPWVATPEDLALEDADWPTPRGADDVDELFDGLEDEPGDGAPEPDPKPAPEPTAVEDDSDFDALIDQLAGGSGPADGPSDTPYVSRPDASSEAESDAQADTFTERPGDVSEFLRELSRLALDEQGGGGPAPAPAQDESETSSSDADDAAGAAADAREAQRNTDPEDKKRRGLFGWGR